MGLGSPRAWRVRTSSWTMPASSFAPSPRGVTELESGRGRKHKRRAAWSSEQRKPEDKKRDPCGYRGGGLLPTTFQPCPLGTLAPPPEDASEFDSRPLQNNLPRSIQLNPLELPESFVKILTLPKSELSLPAPGLTPPTSDPLVRPKILTTPPWNTGPPSMF